MQWSDIDIRIPTVLPDRVESLQSLVRQVREQTGQPPTVSPQPPNAPPSDRVRRIFGRPVGGVWLLHLEDDARLATSFGDVVPHALDETDRRAVSFFDTTDGPDGLTTASKPFYWAQCLAVHASITRGFVDYYHAWLDDHPDHHDAVDLAFGDYTTSLGEPIDVYRPSQVQHRPLPSTLGSRSTHRQSPTFPGGADG